MFFKFALLSKVRKFQGRIADAMRRAGHQTGLHWYGAIAQLGERLHGMQEVSGSIPLGSTNSRSNRRNTTLTRKSSRELVEPSARSDVRLPLAAA